MTKAEQKALMEWAVMIPRWVAPSMRVVCLEGLWAAGQAAIAAWMAKRLLVAVMVMAEAPSSLEIMRDWQ
ncbi:hypothetical protein CK934_14515 [Chitinophaga sp. MD30]|nr:hypothetical protein CK934_14515 [Chitinophaga sp. MD30]